MLLGAASAHDTSLEQTSGLSGMHAGVADSQSEGGVGAANGRVTRRQMIFDPAASQDPQLAGLHAACVAAQPAAVPPPSRLACAAPLPALARAACSVLARQRHLWLCFRDSSVAVPPAPCCHALAFLTC